MVSTSSTAASLIRRSSFSPGSYGACPSPSAPNEFCLLQVHPMSVIPQKKLFADEPKSGKGTKRSLDESEDVGEEDVSETDKKPSAKEQHHAPPSEHDESKTATPTATTSLPARPIKKARTAYFIFADDKRAEIQAKVSLRKEHLRCHRITHAALLIVVL